MKIAAMVVLAVLAAGCGVAVLEPTLHAPGAPVPPPEKKAPALKVHMRTGDLYLLTGWKVEADGRLLRGVGERFTPARAAAGSGMFEIPMEEVVLLETNGERTVYPAGLQALAVMNTFWGAVTGICVADPKSCFGSCPTFYLPGEPDRPAAEGFSASIARVLEERDLDALPRARLAGRRLTVRMRNEALETHAVRGVHLLLAPRPPGGRVLAGVDGRLVAATDLEPPLSCRAEEGDCRRALAAEDGRERAAPADGADLARRETVELAFPARRGRAGVVVSARASLMTTFLLYQSMAYLGRSAGDVLAAMERGGPEGARAMLGMGTVVGGVEVEVAEGDGPWRPAGAFVEMGPLAGDTVVLPVELAGTGPVRVRLRLARGAWRLDAVRLATLGPDVRAQRLAPARVERRGRPDDDALAMLRDPARHLVTAPGDAYDLVFDLPPGAAGSEAFLESEGYYYEWMRGEWLAEEDPAMALLVVTRPEEALRMLAPRFKEREAAMERSFWQSRFRK